MNTPEVGVLSNLYLPSIDIKPSKSLEYKLNNKAWNCISLGFCGFLLHGAPEIASLEVFKASVLVGPGYASTCDKSFDRMQNRLGTSSPRKSIHVLQSQISWHRTYASYDHSHRAVSRAARSIS